MNYMMYLYQHEELLMYIRYHPRWYKILYYDSSMFNLFLDEAKTNLKIRTIDKLNSFNNKFKMFYNLANLIK